MSTSVKLSDDHPCIIDMNEFKRGPHYQVLMEYIRRDTPFTPEAILWTAFAGGWAQAMVRAFHIADDFEFPADDPRAGWEAEQTAMAISAKIIQLIDRKKP